FTIGSVLASDPEKSKMKVPDLHEEDLLVLEKAIDQMNEELPELKSFVLPGGNLVASHCHVARCICRRAERMVVLLSQNAPVPSLIISYLNRLSDYLFVLARYQVFLHKGEELPWRPRM
ncbi:MAG: ATP:cob(I)alamin adenosyltransferase, partial [Bacteroidia bacterium]|nr:ATP:cob(I)alamin adenosyltransferase [Bacteroidia bacterium]